MLELIKDSKIFKFKTNESDLLVHFKDKMIIDGLQAIVLGQ